MILPLWINKISLAILLACKTSCVTRITFTPIELTFFNILSITLVDWGSRLLQGSSNSSKLGLIINALIIANNCCCPIERVLAEEDLYSYKFEIILRSIWLKDNIEVLIQEESSLLEWGRQNRPHGPMTMVRKFY